MANISNDAPPNLMQMFINSSDTLRGREIPQVIPHEWNDRPPLFIIRAPQRRRMFWNRGRQEEEPKEEEGEDQNLLKGMIRKGIPAPLRCAVWLSNIIQASYPHQDVRIAHEYRTLAKVRVLDHAYDSLWESNTCKLQDIQQVTFGNTNIWNVVAEYEGKQSLEKVLFALSHVLGGSIEYAPLVPTLACILLSYMSESYVFCAIREMANHSTWYYATTLSEHEAYGRAFLDILGKLHPHTLETMKEKGFEQTFCQALFQDFLTNLLPEPWIHRLMDIYTLEGTKALFRFGVALVVLYQREWKERYIYELETSWWDGLVKFSQNPTFSFDMLVKKAYGLHGKGIRQRYRFPRRPIIARIIQLEEEMYWDEQLQESATSSSNIMVVKPLGLVPAKPPVEPDQEPVTPRLAESTVVRTKLAEWLPLSLRFTKLELIYSTNHHGRTLENLYRHCSKARRTILLLEPISTKKEMVVGMFAPQTWHPSPRVYGDGSCFLFRIDPTEPNSSETKCWKWHPKELKNLLEESPSDDDSSNHSSDAANATALLEQFQVSTRNFISMGGNPNGTSGLRLNEDLTKGESSPASGFDNEPLAGDLFEIGLVEVYQMVREADGRAVH